MRNNTHEIKETLESVRAEKCPNVDSEIINCVVDIEFDNQEHDSRANGKAQVKEALQEYIETAITDDTK